MSGEDPYRLIRQDLDDCEPEAVDAIIDQLIERGLSVDSACRLKNEWKERRAQRQLWSEVG